MKQMKCRVCNEGNIDLLIKDSKSTSGYRNICKKCHNMLEKKRRSQMPISVKQEHNKQNWKKRKKVIEGFSLDQKIKEWASRFINRGIKDCKNQKWTHTRKNLSLDFLIQLAKDALILFPYMTFLDNKNKWATASVDRIDSNKGYEPENTRVVPFWLNSAMLNMSDSQFSEVITHYYNNFIKEKQ